MEQSYVDILAIASLQNTYAHAIDRRDWVQLRGLFTEDAEILFPPILPEATLEEFIRWAVPFHEGLRRTLHQNTTHTAVIQGGSALAGCYLHAILIDADGRSASSMYSRYEDELVKLGDAWRFRRRTSHGVWSESIG